MLCGIYDDSSPPQYYRHFFRGLRSRKSSDIHDHSRPASAMPYRPRLPSDASSLASSRPSISNRSDLSVDWDPLRLHPPLAPGPSPPLRGDEAARFSRSYQPRELRHARSSSAVRRPSSPPSSPPPTFSFSSSSSSSSSTSCSSSETVIYDGFDFSFGGRGAAPTPSTTTITTTNSTTTTNSSSSKPARLAALGGGGSHTAPPLRRRSPSPTPSEDSLVSSESSDDLGLDPPPPAGLSAPPRPRRPRVRNAGAAAAAPSLLGDEAEYFPRRDGWKRMGIVFVDGSPLDGGEGGTFFF
ncbi:hypothetical protein VTK26DRAFT_8876 [Humicola hyalothermophila]